MIKTVKLISPKNGSFDKFETASSFKQTINYGAFKNKNKIKTYIKTLHAVQLCSLERQQKIPGCLEKHMTEKEKKRKRNVAT